MISSFVITGFLGVGKTTLLINTVKNYFQDKKVAIVINEFGEVGVDGTILKNVYSEVLEISEGCICCKLSEEFEKGVREIIQNYNPEIIFVETSGTSEPFPIFMSLQNLGISVDGVICVIDTKNFDNYKDHSTAKYQIGGSNILVLNKIDLVDEDTLKRVENEVREIKEKYNVKNILTGQPIFKNYVLFKTKYGVLPEEIFLGVADLEKVSKLPENTMPSTHIYDDKFSQKIIYLPDTMEFKELDKLLSNVPKNIYRIKGIVKLKDIPNPLIVNYSFGDLTFEEFPEYNGKSFLVFIGSGLENQNIIKLN